jgi:hypothetical protein
VYSVMSFPSVLPNGLSVMPTLFSFLFEESVEEADWFAALLHLVTTRAKEAINSDRIFI